MFPVFQLVKTSSAGGAGGAYQVNREERWSSKKLCEFSEETEAWEYVIQQERKSPEFLTLLPGMNPSELEIAQALHNFLNNPELFYRRRYFVGFVPFADIVESLKKQGIKHLM